MVELNLAYIRTVSALYWWQPDESKATFVHV